MTSFVCQSCWSFGLDYQTCAKCKGPRYCTRGCQLEDWKRHKINCKRTLTKQKHLETLHQWMLMLAMFQPEYHQVLKDKDFVMTSRTLENMWIKIKTAFESDEQLKAAIKEEAKTVFDEGV